MATSSSLDPDIRLEGPQFTRALLAWGVAVGIALILCVLTLPTYIDWRLSFSPGNNLSLINHFIYVGVILLLGCVLFIKQRHDRMSVLASGFFITYALTNSVPVLSSPPVVVSVLAFVSIFIGLALFCLYFFFPDGQLAYPVVSLILVGCLLLLQFVGSSLAFEVRAGIVLALWIAVLGFIYYRYRHTVSAPRRQQFKWAMFGLIGIIASNLLNLFNAPLTNALLTMGRGDDWFTVVNRGSELIRILLLLMGPLFITLALLRVPTQADTTAHAE
jgi:hypothetical protein